MTYDQEQMWKGVKVVQQLLIIDWCSKSWCLSNKYYMAAEECTIHPGTPSFFSVWFQQATNIHESQEANLLIVVQALHGNVLIDKGANLEDILELWALLFTSISIMNSCQTPVHRDSSGGFKCMDLLAIVSPYTNGKMDIPTVSIWVCYSAGTMVSITRRALLHATEATGERACFAYYMRHNVLKHLNLEEPGWAKVSDINDMVADMMEPDAKPKRQ
ncbi:unnamed protein product [Cyclocybe aegerita]|uniref:Uncharacterized protein n=1 Tax=Cyclocybe aegerita TaxID=1973307 RepID=A0A8S0WYC1_CYCAE|nr:unnamed protein product [Cyclocybe aegerita]